MATLPRRVQQQLDEANALLATQATPEAQTAEQTSVPEQPAEPQTQTAAPTGEADQSAQPTAPVQPEPPRQAVDWEHKFKTLQGLFNSHMPQLQRENKELIQKIQHLTQTVESLQQSKAEPPKGPTETVDPRDVDAYGQDLVEMVHRQIRAVLAAPVQKMNADMADLVKRLSALEEKVTGAAKTAAVTAEELFFANLAKEVPDYEQINVDQRFLDWLAQIDPVYGVPRQAALTTAQQNLDAGRVAAVFKAFKATLPQEPVQRPADKQVSPKPSASVAPTPAQKPVLSQREIAAFYDDVAKGKYRGREAEAQRKEQIINEAIADGRIQ